MQRAHYGVVGSFLGFILLIGFQNCAQTKQPSSASTQDDKVHKISDSDSEKIINSIESLALDESENPAYNFSGCEGLYDSELNDCLWTKTQNIYTYLKTQRGYELIENENCLLAVSRNHIAPGESVAIFSTCRRSDDLTLERALHIDECVHDASSSNAIIRFNQSQELDHMSTNLRLSRQGTHNIELLFRDFSTALNFNDACSKIQRYQSANLTFSVEVF